PGLYTQLFQRIAIVVERMSREIAAHRDEFAMQALGGQPGLADVKMQLLWLERGGAEDVALPHRGIFGRTGGEAHQPVYALEQSRAIVAEAIERAGANQAFQHPLADDARIHAAAEILDALEGLFLPLL